MNKASLKSILQILKRQKVMKLPELVKLFGNRMEVTRKAKEGLIQSLGNGFYASNEMDPFTANLYLTTKYYPQGVISGKTALYLYGYSQNFIQKIDIDIKRGSSIRNKLFQVHRVPDKRLIGITHINYEGIKILVYDKERTLAEAYLLDPEGELFYRALKRYIKTEKINIEKFLYYDQVFKNQDNSAS